MEPLVMSLVPSRIYPPERGISLPRVEHWSYELERGSFTFLDNIHVL